MKLRIVMKDPDGVSNSVSDAVHDSVNELGLPRNESDAVLEARMETVNRVLQRWFRWNEYVTIEVDTDTGTAVVVEAAR